jgi:hypothetical protein
MLPSSLRISVSGIGQASNFENNLLYPPLDTPMQAFIWRFRGILNEMVMSGAGKETGIGERRENLSSKGTFCSGR